MASDGAPTVVLQRMSSTWLGALCAGMDEQLSSAARRFSRRGYTCKQRLSNSVAGAGGEGDAHAPLQLLHAAEPCALCDLTAQLGDEFKFGFVSDANSPGAMTNYKCEECGVALHASCAWYWHSRKCPYSRYVTGTFEPVSRQWPTEDRPLPTFARTPTLPRAGVPDERGARAMLALLDADERWRSRLVASREREHTLSKIHLLHSLVPRPVHTQVGECELCKMTQGCWPSDAPEKKTKSTPYKCLSCGVFLHVDCHRLWHSEATPFSRIVWRGRAKLSGPLIEAGATASLVRRVREIDASLPAVRITHTPHKLALGRRARACVLCELSARADGKDPDRIELAGSWCEQCNVALHRDCAQAWHAEVVPYSRRVFGSTRKR